MFKKKPVDKAQIIADAEALRGNIKDLAKARNLGEIYQLMMKKGQKIMTEIIKMADANTNYEFAALQQLAYHGMVILTEITPNSQIRLDKITGDRTYHNWLLQELSKLTKASIKTIISNGSSLEVLEIGEFNAEIVGDLVYNKWNNAKFPSAA